MKNGCGMALAFVLGAAALAQGGPKQNPPAAPVTSTQQRGEAPTGGQLFEMHCRRCHQYPLTLPRKAARTVVTHMQVRALLPPEQAQRILKFLAP